MPAEVQQIVRDKNDSRVGRKLTMFDTAGPAVRLWQGSAELWRSPFRFLQGSGQNQEPFEVQDPCEHLCLDKKTSHFET